MRPPPLIVCSKVLELHMRSSWKLKLRPRPSTPASRNGEVVCTLKGGEAGVDEAGADAAAVVEELVLPGGVDFGGEAAVPACEKNKTPAAFPRPGLWVNVLQSA